MSSITLRTATLADLPLLRHWDTQPHVIAASDDDWEWETELGVPQPWREQLIAELDGRPIGFIQVIDPQEEETHYWGEIEPNLRALDIWIGEAEDLGKGYGTEMMIHAINRCFAQAEVSAILVDPLERNTRVHAFYERLGFRLMEKRYFDGDYCRVYRLEREYWQM